jgi:hypothetical protein
MTKVGDTNSALPRCSSVRPLPRLRKIARFEASSAESAGIIACCAAARTGARISGST